MREAVIKTIEEDKKEVAFAFCIQKQIDPIKMPVENSEVEWSEKGEIYLFRRTNKK